MAPISYQLCRAPFRMHYFYWIYRISFNTHLNVEHRIFLVSIKFPTGAKNLHILIFILAWNMPFNEQTPFELSSFNGIKVNTKDFLYFVNKSIENENELSYNILSVYKLGRFTNLVWSPISKKFQNYKKWVETHCNRESSKLNICKIESWSTEFSLRIGKSHWNKHRLHWNSWFRAIVARDSFSLSLSHSMYIYIEIWRLKYNIYTRQQVLSFAMHSTSK